MFRAIGPAGDRVCAVVQVEDDAGQLVFEGETNDERFDANDHLTATLKRNADYRIRIRAEEGRSERTVRLSDDGADRRLISFRLPDAQSEQPAEPSQLTRTQADELRQQLWRDYRERIARQHKQEMEQQLLEVGEYKMPFHYQVFGSPPPEGHSLYISLHGGGGAPKRVNDRQWENQKRLYS